MSNCYDWWFWLIIFSRDIHIWSISRSYNKVHRVSFWLLRQEIYLNCCPLHTVSFDWLLSGLGWIINLDFCYWNFWYFTRNYYRISDLGLILPYFELLSLYLDKFDQNWSFLNKKWRFWSNIFKYRLKTQNVEELSLDLTFHNIFR